MGKKNERDYCSNYDAALPEVSRNMAIACLFMNCIPLTPGLGTCVSACFGKSFSWSPIVIGIFQHMLSVAIVGYIWSILHGAWLLEKYYAGINECLDCGRRREIAKEVEKTEAENRKIPAHEQISANIKF